MNETTIRVAGKHVTIWQKSPGVPVEKGDAMRYKHRITVHVDGKYRAFSFYGSVFDYQNRRDMLEKGELNAAFYRIVGDALTTREGVDMKKRFDELGFSGEDLVEIYNKLGEGDYGGRAF